MYLDHISIRNFRLFESLDLKLNSGLNVIVGENDSGKTTIIDAIRYTLGNNSSENIYIEESDFYEESNNLSIQLKFVDVDDYAHIFVEHLSYELNQENHKPSLYVQLSADKTSKEKRGYPYIKTEIRSGKNGNGLILESEIRQFLATTYLKPLRDAESELSAGKRSRLSQILSSSNDLNSEESVKKLLELVAETNSALIKSDEPIHITSEKIKHDYLHKLIFEEDKKSFEAIITIAGLTTKNLDKLNGIQKRKYMREIFERLNLSLTGEIRKHGLGYNNLLFIAAELLLLEQESESDTELPLLLIEEPEAHLHPQLQLKLLQFINEKIKTSENPKGIQCLVTTHSPNISSKAKPEDIIIMNKGKAFPLHVGETELAKKDYIFLEKFLDATKANLFFARAVILVEGDSELILLPTIAKLLGKPLEDYGVSVIKCSDSHSWKRFAKIFLRKDMDNGESDWNPIKLAILRDLDLWPACAEKKDLVNPYGFKKREDRNTQYWEKEEETERAKQKSDKIDELKKDNNRSLEKQNVKIFVSDEWTFEYCLAYFGLFEDCCEAADISEKIRLGALSKTNEEQSTLILSKIKKTDFAYKMVTILEKEYTKNMDGLKSKLPPYIIKAIEYVTSLAENKATEQEGLEDVKAA